MTDTALDRPDVIIFPPVIPLIRRWRSPACCNGWCRLAGSPGLEPPVRIGIGAIIALAGTGHDVGRTARADARAAPTSIRRGRPPRSSPTACSGTPAIRSMSAISVALCGIALIFASRLGAAADHSELACSCILPWSGARSAISSRNSATPTAATRRACRAISPATERLSDRHVRQGKIMIKSLFRISVSVGLLGDGLRHFHGHQAGFRAGAGACASQSARLRHHVLVRAVLPRLSDGRRELAWRAIRPSSAWSARSCSRSASPACCSAGTIASSRSWSRGALIVFAGMVLFVVIVYRTAGCCRPAIRAATIRSREE